MSPHHVLQSSTSSRYVELYCTIEFQSEGFLEKNNSHHNMFLPIRNRVFRWLPSPMAATLYITINPGSDVLISAHVSSPYASALPRVKALISEGGCGWFYAVS